MKNCRSFLSKIFKAESEQSACWNEKRSRNIKGYGRDFGKLKEMSSVTSIGTFKQNVFKTDLVYSSQRHQARQCVKMDPVFKTVWLKKCSYLYKLYRYEHFISQTSEFRAVTKFKIECITSWHHILIHSTMWIQDWPEISIMFLSMSKDLCTNWTCSLLQHLKNWTP